MSTNVSIIGLGLMGASLGGALKHAGGWTVTGTDTDARRMAIALDGGFIDKRADSFTEAVESADIIVLATPISVILKCLDALKDFKSRTATVIDLGSTKRSIVARMMELPEGMESIGGHPMAGKVTSNTEGSDIDLYRGKKFILVEHERTGAMAREHATRLLGDIGAVTVKMDAEAHDRAVAMVSHLPHFMSIPLLMASDSLHDKSLWSLAAGGYRKAASASADNPTMWKDIAVDNFDNIAKALKIYGAHMQEFARLLEGADRQQIVEVLDRAEQVYSKFSAAQQDANRMGAGRPPGEPVKDYQVNKGVVGSYGVLGSAGSWSHAAAAEAYPEAERVGLPSFDAVAEGLVSGAYDIAVFPVRNSITGAIPRVADIIAAHELHVYQQLTLPIHHCLVGPQPMAGKAPSSDLPVKIYSHPQGFLQCSIYLETNFPNAEYIEVSDTATGIQQIANSTSETDLAIGSAFAARLYGGVILKEAINNDRENATTFSFCRTSTNA